MANFKRKTARLVVLARAMIASLGVDPGLITECPNDDIDGVFVHPGRGPVPKEDDCWYLSVAGTDCPYVDEPGIDVVVIRPDRKLGDRQDPLRGVDDLLAALVADRHLPQGTVLNTYVVRRYRRPGAMCGMALVRAVSQDAAEKSAFVLWPDTYMIRVRQVEAAF
jgi:hypothetical protein